jgi:hypothetical protein
MDCIKKKGQVSSIINDHLTIQHGMLLAVYGNVTPLSLDGLSQVINERWGIFCVRSSYNYFARYGIAIPSSNSLPDKQFLQYAIIFKNITCLSDLTSKWKEMLISISTDKYINNVIMTQISRVNHYLQVWQSEGCPTITHKYHVCNNDVPLSSDNKHEFISHEKYGRNVMRYNLEFAKMMTLYLEQVSK